jgi:hypothetical protein
MSAPLEVRVCRKGEDPTTDAVTITIDHAAVPKVGKGVIGWGTELPTLLREAARVCEIGRLGVWYAADGEEEDLPQTRGGWGTVQSLTPADVIVVEGRRQALDEDPVYELPGGEQNSKRLYDLYLGGNCIVREALQEVRSSLLLQFHPFCLTARQLFSQLNPCPC